MKIVLTGGIACGKSQFAKFLQELGVLFLDADDVVHSLENVGGGAVDEIVDAFGKDILDAQGGVDRTKLKRVFQSGNIAERKKLESILHPKVREQLLQFVNQPKGVRIVVIPLLFESHWEKDYDIIIVITSPKEVQIERMMKYRGYLRVEAEERLAAQMPVDDKVSRADYVVVNDSTSDKLKEKARQLHAWLIKRLKYE